MQSHSENEQSLDVSFFSVSGKVCPSPAKGVVEMHMYYFGAETVNNLKARHCQNYRENTKRGALLHGVPYGVPKMEYP